MNSGPHMIHFKVKATGPSTSTPATSSSSGSWSTVQWDGINHLTTLDLKRHITAQLGLHSSTTPFEFILTNATTGEDYREDNFVVHKNTSVWVKKVNGTPERAELLKQKPSTGTTTSQSSPAPSSSSLAGAAAHDEEQKLLNLVQQSSRSRAPAPSTSSYAPPTYQRTSHGSGPASSHFAPNAKPPPGYICHRCQQPGHYIRSCPTNGDPAFDGRRPKAAIAVAQYENNSQKFFLREVEDPKAAREEEERRGRGRGEEGGGGGVYNDSFITAPSRGAPYEEQRGPPMRAPAPGGRAPVPADLQCPLCHQLFDDPHVVSCCFATFCRKCILDALEVAHSAHAHTHPAAAAAISHRSYAPHPRPCAGVCVEQVSPFCPRCKQTVVVSELRPNVGLQRKVAELRRSSEGHQQPPPPPRRPSSPPSSYHPDRSRSPTQRDRRSRSPTRRVDRSPPRERQREWDRERDRGGDRGSYRDVDRERYGAPRGGVERSISPSMSSYPPPPPASYSHSGSGRYHPSAPSSSPPVQHAPPAAAGGRREDNGYSRVYPGSSPPHSAYTYPPPPAFTPPLYVPPPRDGKDAGGGAGYGGGGYHHGYEGHNDDGINGAGGGRGAADRPPYY